MNLKPSTFVTVLTAIQALMILFLIFNLFFAFLFVPQCLSAVLIIVLGFFLLQMPLGVTITPEGITVSQLLSNVSFDRKSCTMRKLKDTEMKNTIRLFGTGGMGGYTGHFRNPAIGNFKMYAVSKKNLWLIIDAQNKKHVINLFEDFLE